jgi:hypothetical protein
MMVSYVWCLCCVHVMECLVVCGARVSDFALGPVSVR